LNLAYDLGQSAHVPMVDFASIRSVPSGLRHDCFAPHESHLDSGRPDHLDRHLIWINVDGVDQVGYENLTLASTRGVRPEIRALERTCHLVESGGRPLSCVARATGGPPSSSGAGLVCNGVTDLDRTMVPPTSRPQAIRTRGDNDWHRCDGA
jgi:hypothetical protein